MTDKEPVIVHKTGSTEAEEFITNFTESLKKLKEEDIEIRYEECIPKPYMAITNKSIVWIDGKPFEYKTSD